MSQLVAALVAAGIEASQAARLAGVLNDLYGSTQGKFGALDVTGAATVVGAMQINDTVDVTGEAIVGSLDCSGGAIVDRSLGVHNLIAKAGDVGCVRAGPSSAQVFGPLQVAGGINAQGGAAFGGNAVFQNGVQIRGKVDWNGQRKPANVDVITGVFGNPGNAEAMRGKVALRRRKVAVLNDHGDGGWSTMSATLGATSVGVTATGAVTISPNFTTQVVYSLGAVTFNETNCAVEATSTAVTVVTGWNPAVTVAITMCPTNPMPVFVGRTDDGPGQPVNKIVNLHIQ